MIKVSYALFGKGVSVRVRGKTSRLIEESCLIVRGIYDSIKNVDAQDAATYKQAIIDALTDAEDATDD